MKNSHFIAEILILASLIKSGTRRELRNQIVHLLILHMRKLIPRDCPVNQLVCIIAGLESRLSDYQVHAFHATSQKQRCVQSC